MLSMAEFILETNYPSLTNYPSETDNSSKYKLWSKIRLRVIRLLARHEDVLIGKFVLDG